MEDVRIIPGTFDNSQHDTGNNIDLISPKRPSLKQKCSQKQKIQRPCLSIEDHLMGSNDLNENSDLSIIIPTGREKIQKQILREAKRQKAQNLGLQIKIQNAFQKTKLLEFQGPPKMYYRNISSKKRDDTTKVQNAKEVNDIKNAKDVVSTNDQENNTNQSNQTASNQKFKPYSYKVIRPNITSSSYDILKNTFQKANSEFLIKTEQPITLPFYSSKRNRSKPKRLVQSSKSRKIQTIPSTTPIKTTDPSTSDQNDLKSETTTTVADPNQNPSAKPSDQIELNQNISNSNNQIKKTEKSSLKNNRKNLSKKGKKIKRKQSENNVKSSKGSVQLQNDNRHSDLDRITDRKSIRGTYTEIPRKSINISWMTPMIVKRSEAKSAASNSTDEQTIKKSEESTTIDNTPESGLGGEKNMKSNMKKHVENSNDKNLDQNHREKLEQGNETHIKFEETSDKIGINQATEYKTGTSHDHGEINKNIIQEHETGFNGKPKTKAQSRKGHANSKGKNGKMISDRYPRSKLESYKQNSQSKIQSKENVRTSKVLESHTDSDAIEHVRPKAPWQSNNWMFESTFHKRKQYEAYILAHQYLLRKRKRKLKVILKKQKNANVNEVQNIIEEKKRRKRGKQRQSSGVVRNRKNKYKDPAALFNYYKYQWDRFQTKFPGESVHSKLRQIIHEKMQAQPNSTKK